MNLSGKPKEFTLEDIEETDGEPVKVHITQMSPEEVDEREKAAGKLNLSDFAKVQYLAKQKGISIEDLAKEDVPEDKKGQMLIDMFGIAAAAGIELPDVSAKKRTAVEIFAFLKLHVIGWSGVFDDDGKAVPFTEENQQVLLTAFPAIVKDKIVDAIEHLTQHGVLPGEENSSSS